MEAYFLSVWLQPNIEQIIHTLPDPNGKDKKKISLRLRLNPLIIKRHLRPNSPRNANKIHAYLSTL